MKIVIKKNEQVAKHTIDTKECIYPYAIKRAFRLAMELDGFAKQTIDEVFGESEDFKSKKMERSTYEKLNQNKDEKNR